MTLETAPRQQTSSNLASAVHRAQKLSKTGLLERAFTFAFRGLVYPQIWEDPIIDMEAMAIEPGQHIVAIASGGCNILSYLVANPGKVTALDLNGAHIELNKLKLCAARNMPDHASFHQFFGAADSRENEALYYKALHPHLSDTSRKFWEARNWRGRRRLSIFRAVSSLKCTT